MKYLYKHDTPETAIVISNYPYGFRLRTQIRYWIESKKKTGDRFASQTLNPKTNTWNKPKYSTYDELMVMIEKDDGHISYISLSHWDSKEEFLTKLEKIDQTQLNDLQRDQILILRAIHEVRQHITYTVTNTTHQSEEERAKHDQEQKEIKQSINKLVGGYYLKFKKENNEKPQK